MSDRPVLASTTTDSTTNRVLLVDDQQMIAEAVKRMVLSEKNFEFHYCQDPRQAIPMANSIRPTVILQDLVMPDIDGLTLVKYFRRNPATIDTPMIVLSSKEEAITKADAFAAGANDYLVKLPDKIELMARIKYHSRGYLNLLQRNAAYKELAENRKRLAEELDAGLRYVNSLMPRPWTEGKSPGGLLIDWRFVPTSQMGGDALGYHELDKDHIALYVLDVTGHGLGSALLSVTILNVIRNATLPNTDFREPDQVLRGLNDAFPPEKHGEKFFSIWYGVYNPTTRVIRWSNAGHPQALLYCPVESKAKKLKMQPPIELGSLDPWIGLMPPETTFEKPQEQTIPHGSRLFIYSDGAHEIHLQDGTDWQMNEFIETMSDFVKTQPEEVMDSLHKHIVELHGSNVLDDDLSLMDVRFP
jgi:phosphoserine phosphatase RsbU/P